jgi:DNA polymerase-3 subunit delta
MDFKSLQQQIKNKDFKPVYLLQGEEPLFIDQLSKLIHDNVLEDYERDFNETIVYGKDADVRTVVLDAKGFPMMAERRFVMVREAQEMKDIDLLESYLENPNPSTVLVLAHKYKKVDSRKKVAKLFSKAGVVFTSDKIKEYQLVDWITKYVATVNFQISSKAAFLLAENIGNDLSRIAGEIEKLSIILEKGTTINEIHIEENIGISKDYNMFELSSAVQNNDYLKAMKIITYFKHNPKSGPLVVIIGSLYNLYSQLMKVHFLADKSPQSVASSLRVHPFVAGELVKAAKICNPKTIARNINYLYQYDLKSKGIGDSHSEDAELMTELVYKLLH